MKKIGALVATLITLAALALPGSPATPAAADPAPPSTWCTTLAGSTGKLTTATIAASGLNPYHVTGNFNRVQYLDVLTRKEVAAGQFAWQVRLHTEAGHAVAGFWSNIDGGWEFADGSGRDGNELLITDASGVLEEVQFCTT